MSSKISQDKISQVVHVMTKDLELVQKELLKSLSEYFAKALFDRCPQNVKDLYFQAPLYFRSVPSFYFRLPDGHAYYMSDIKAPYSFKIVDDMIPYVIRNSKYVKEIHAISLSLSSLASKEKSLKGKIRCALSELNTYKKIKDNFPEAYEVIMLIDGMGSVEDKGSNMCDSVENLRAELSQISKKSKK